MTRVGLDETRRRRGHHYVSLFVHLDRPQLLFATPGRDAGALRRFKTDLVAHHGRVEAIGELVMRSRVPNDREPHRHGDLIAGKLDSALPTPDSEEPQMFWMRPVRLRPPPR